MNKVDAIYRLFDRGYYDSSHALAIGQKKLSSEEYTELYTRIVQKTTDNNYTLFQTTQQETKEDNNTE